MIMARIVKSLLAVSCLAVASSATAGTWNQGNWGQMYWGTNTESAPVAPPQIASIEADLGDLIITVGDYSPGDDGWSTITSYSAQCGGEPEVVSSSSTIRIEGLPQDASYQCIVQAINALGLSPTSLSDTVVLEGTSTGLNIVILRAAYCMQTPKPSGC